MKIYLAPASALLSVLLLLSGCWLEDEFDCTDGDGPIETRALPVDIFDGIILEMDARLFVTQGSEFEVLVEGKDNIIDEIELDVRNGVWTIDTDRCVRDLGDMRIFVTMPDIRMLATTGSGDILAENVLQLNDIELRITGSGDMDLELIADDVDIQLSGSGDASLFGECDELKARVSGSGDIRAFGLLAREGDIRVSGSGDVEVSIEEFLLARISGSGDIRYRGNPVVDDSTTGTGRVIQD